MVFASRRPAFSPTKAEPLPNLSRSFLICYDEQGVNLSGKTNRYDKKREFQWGAWNNGQVYSSPLWVGYRIGNTISRIGYSHQRVQDATQNVIHRYFPPGRQHYYNKYDHFNAGMYGYSGYYNPFSLYHY